MRFVRLRVQVPEGVHPVVDCWTHSPAIDRVQGLHWNVTDEGVAIMDYVEGDEEVAREVLASADEVVHFDVTPAGDGFYVHVIDSTTPVTADLFDTFASGSLLVVPPVEYGDGEVRVSVVGTDDDLQRAVAAIPETMPTTIEAVGEYDRDPDTARDALSARQDDALAAAVAVGYYDVPRTGTIEDVAAELGISPSTAAEHVQKAESKLVRETYSR
ncbi:helix-turn-helix domain-containing protein [Haloarchaeobius sp. TZWSO28]|uniref:helix-turn-helix domain-containing protein n=1 Tax=Haloarchaeobius sp. TZWSO28 TaxID=3446119 RepID=UPI003EBBF224